MSTVRENSDRRQKRFLLKHVGNMGDLVFFVPPVLETLKRVYPGCHITFVTAWGFKDRRGRWGQRNQGGFCLNLMMTNPHIDQLVHWDDRHCAPGGGICYEDGQWFPTWNRDYFEQVKRSGDYDEVCELDFGMKADDNPLERLYAKLGLPGERYANYRLYFTEADKAVAARVMRDVPRPRIALLEGLNGTSTRGWDPARAQALSEALQQKYGAAPRWFGAAHTPELDGRPLTLRENIATLLHFDVAIGVLSGPLHFAAAVGLPTLTLYAEHPLRRAAPAYFLNEYIDDATGDRNGKYLTPHPSPSKESGNRRKHRTLLAPSVPGYQLLKYGAGGPPVLTPAERVRQRWRSWNKPGRQATKSPLAVITVEEVMAVLQTMID